MCWVCVAVLYYIPLILRSVWNLKIFSANKYRIGVDLISVLKSRGMLGELISRSIYTEAIRTINMYLYRGNKLTR